jgi:hypothetical protein
MPRKLVLFLLPGVFERPEYSKKNGCRARLPDAIQCICNQSKGETMKRRSLHILMILSFVFFCGHARAQDKAQPMTNQGVIAMVKAGLPDATVISAIQSQPTNFDISADGLLALKNAGVSDKVVSAVVAAAGKRQQTVPAPQAPQSAPAAPSALAPASAPPAAPAGASSAEIPPGTPIVVRTIDPIDSRTAREGHVFKASLDQAIQVYGAPAIPAGSDVTLKLVRVKQSGRFTGTTDLTVTIDSLMVNGNPVPVQVGEVTNSSSGRGKRSAEVVGGGAAVGAVLGGIFGGRRGAAIGSALGAGAGAAERVVTRGQKVTIPAETRLTFTTTAQARI